MHLLVLFTVSVYCFVQVLVSMHSVNIMHKLLLITAFDVSCIDASIDTLSCLSDSCICEKSFIHAVIKAIIQVVVYMRILIHVNAVLLQSLTKVISHY